MFCFELIEDVGHFIIRHNVHLCLDPSDTEDISSRRVPLNQRVKHICSNQSVADYTFTRKDLLAQHIRGIHLRFANESLEKGLKVPEEWIKEVDAARIKPDALWCGFCLESFDCIPDRMVHVANHFRDGSNMDAWLPRAA